MGRLLFPDLQELGLADTKAHATLGTGFVKTFNKCCSCLLISAASATHVHTAHLVGRLCMHFSPGVSERVHYQWRSRVQASSSVVSLLRTLSIK